jgi:hypothetical protein
MANTAVIRCAGASTPGLVGKYLKAYDVEASGGHEVATWTRDRREALVFPSFIGAFEAWRSQSVTVPLRADGKPNRPLTAYSVKFEDGP